MYRTGIAFALEPAPRRLPGLAASTGTSAEGSPILVKALCHSPENPRRRHLRYPPHLPQHPFQGGSYSRSNGITTE
jgi:hypothetical protein